MDLSFTLLFHTHHDTEAEKSSAAAYAEVLDLIRRADALPIACAWLAEHHLSPTRGRIPAPLLMVVAAARETQRIRLGPCVLLLPLHHPLDLAEQVAEADLLTGGRLVAGAGSGGNPEEFAGYGVPLEERRARFAEALEVFARALGRGEFSYTGTYYTIPPVTLVPRPLQVVTDLLWVAASSLGSATVAGRSGGHLLTSRGMPIPDLLEQIAVYREARSTAGYDPASAAIQVTRGIYVAESEEAAWHEAEPGIRRHYSYVPRYGGEDCDVREMARRGDFIVGTPEQVAEQVEALASAVPITHLACDISLNGVPHERITRSLDLLGREVIPLVQDVMPTPPQM
jgi:alkanesulfonate monooxygenase SsuD/methylene tetrahydromethanopterin reductase-like flavin-dependent oxidoreductase (luciferase family)